MGGSGCGESQPVPTRAASWIEACCQSSAVALEPLAAGAGARRYARVHLANGTSVVWMHAIPEDPEILPAALRAPSADLPFVTVTEILAEQGLPVPQIYGVQRDERWILVEDLGDRHVSDLPQPQRLDRQKEAVELLARVHTIPRGETLPFTRHFDEEWICFELAHFLKHGVAEAFREPLTAGLEELARLIARLPRALCLRDFQSQNLMVDPSGKLRILDYQDALLAPPELDLAALLYDSYIEISDEDRHSLLERYAKRRGDAPGARAMALLVIQRKCKDFARFRYLARVKHDVRFTHYERSARQAVLSALPSLPAELGGFGQTLAEALGEGPA